jgi:transposase InsO family protein
MIGELQRQTGANGVQVSEAVGLGYRRLLRWRKRASAGKPALVPPGPKKTAPLPLAELKAEIAALSHGRRRSNGTTELYSRNRNAISRREMARLVAEERGQQNRSRRQVCKRVTWHAPNLAWAIDTTERGRDSHGQKLYVHATQDLCSRYRFNPLVALESKGEPVAVYLDGLFSKYGAPLFIKRDNGSPLNGEAVDAVLARYGVIPLNSPARYPQYNGAIEKGIREIKEALGECLPQPVLWQPAAVAPYVNAVRYELNCRPRRCLNGRSACEAYHHQPHVRYSMRDRLAIFEWMRIHVRDRINQLEKIDRRSVLASWRAAAETWLRCQGLITVSINQKVLPYLPKKYVQD